MAGISQARSITNPLGGRRGAPVRNYWKMKRSGEWEEHERKREQLAARIEAARLAEQRRAEAKRERTRAKWRTHLGC